MPNSTAYPEITGVPLTPTKELAKVPKRIRDVIFTGVSQGDAEFDATDDQPELTADVEEGDAADEVPLFWLQNHPLVIQELKHQFRRCTTFIDMSPGDGVMGEVCLVDKTKYMCFALNAEHSSFLTKRWSEMLSEKVLLKDP
jgi:hypothetical protein